MDNTPGMRSSNTAKRQSAKKRSRPARGKSPRRQGGGGQAPRNDLVSQMKSATKSLAQFLAGHTRVSGQYKHAVNVLARVEEQLERRPVESMRPTEKEDVLEHLARLKLTIADAEEDGLTDSDEQTEAEPVKNAEPASADVMSVIMALSGQPSTPYSEHFRQQSAVAPESVAAAAVHSDDTEDDSETEGEASDDAIATNGRITLSSRSDAGIMGASTTRSAPRKSTSLAARGRRLRSLAGNSKDEEVAEGGQPRSVSARSSGPDSAGPAVSADS